MSRSSQRNNPYNLPPLKDRIRETFFTFFKFGYTSFGGPMVHTNMLNDEIVVKRGWVLQEQFAELFAISQSLPGPAAALLAYSLTLLRSGFVCAIFGFILWSFPGAVVCTVAGLLIGDIKGDQPIWAIRLEQGLAAAAIGLVALAAHRMSRNLATDNLTRVLAMCAASVSVLYTSAWVLPVVMISGGLISFVFDTFLSPLLNQRDEKKRLRQREAKATSLKDDLENGRAAAQEAELSDDKEKHVEKDDSAESLSSRPVQSVKEEIPDVIIGEYDDHGDTSRKLFSYSRKLSLTLLAFFISFLVASILVRARLISGTAPGYGDLASTFYFVGSIIFGGGPVIIPLLKTYVVDSGWMTSQQFLIGLSLVQSLPGPNFNFACYLGAVAMINIGNNGLAGAIVSYIAIFCPGLVLKSVIIPFWQLLRERPAVKRVFRGVNACALGLIFSAVWMLFEQVVPLGGSDGYHVVIAGVAFITAGFLKFPAPVTIVLGGAMGAIEYAVSDR
ncbi:chromate transporter-domain-containing protein [Linnemannia elongata]|nr:chromate transporter-domain-containing protein [Linnemannia elongata]